MPIDSKFLFLENFERMVTAELPEEQVRLRKQFIRNVKMHVDNVSKKYIKPDEGTFNFALMYIPAENVYYEAVVRCPKSGEEGDINSYCVQKRVFPVSPNTFHTYLQAIVFGLRGLQLEKSAGQMRGRLERIQGELQDFQEDYELIGRHISHAANKHTEAGSKLNRISGRVELITGEKGAEKLPEGSPEATEDGG